MNLYGNELGDLTGVLHHKIVLFVGCEGIQNGKSSRYRGAVYNATNI